MISPAIVLLDVAQKDVIVSKQDENAKINVIREVRNKSCALT